MGMNPKKNDAWPPWPRVAFVLIQQPGKQRPVRGLILDWRATGSRHQALVVYVSDRTPTRPAMTCQEWFFQEHLTPVDVDPNYRAGTHR